MKRTRKSSTQALLVIDVINDLEFDGGENVLPWAKKMATKLRQFRACARRAGIPVIYVNDNFDNWRSDFHEVFRHASRAGVRGRAVVKTLKPTADDYFILKPMHSGFFCTSLDPLLKYLKVKNLILTGIATNLCVLFTAHDAHMLGYKLTVLSDCCAAESDHDHNVALDQLKRFCHATICTSDEFSISR